jgi:hypothetical protein
MNKIKILLTYIIYPLAMATYFKKALEHREDVDLKVSGPYTSNWIPWMGGMTVPMKYAQIPDIPLPFSPSVGEINYEIIKAQLGDWVPDLIIQVDAGLHFKYKPTDGMVVTIATDPHVLSYDVPRAYSDKFFNMQLIYSKPGDIYLPYAYSRYDHFPEDAPNPDETVDAVLIGMPYDKRVHWVNELRRRGVNVIFENGPTFNEARGLYNRGKIGLNWSSMEDLNARAFELPAMHLYPVMNRVPDMQNFETFDYCGIFENTLDDAVEKVLWAKEHPDEAAAQAEKAYDAVKFESYDFRINQVLRECRFI